MYKGSAMEADTPGSVCRELTSSFKMHALVSSLHTAQGAGLGGELTHFAVLR